MFDEIDRIEDNSPDRENTNLLYYLVMFVLVAALVGGGVYLFVRFGPEIKRLGHNRLFVRHAHNRTCTSNVLCTLNSSKTIGVYSEGSIFNEAEVTTVYGDAITNSLFGLVGVTPPTIIGNLFKPPNATVSVVKEDIANYTRCITGLRCIDYTRIPFFFQKPIRPGVYCFRSETPEYTLVGNWDIVLDGKNRSNPAWVFILDFSMVMNPFSKVRVVNTDYRHNNVWYFKRGFLYMSKNSHFQGSVVANRNVIMEQNTTITGKAISVTGFVATYNSTINIDGGFGPKNCSQ